MNARQQQNTDIDRLYDVFLRVSTIATISVFLGYPLTVIAIGNAIYKSPLVTNTFTWFLFCFPVYVTGIVCLPYFWRGGFLYLLRRFELSATAALDISADGKPYLLVTPQKAAADAAAAAADAARYNKQ